MNKFLFLISFSIIFTTISFSQNTDTPKDVIVSTSDDGVLYGTELDPSITSVSLSDLIASPENFDGKTINLKGNIDDVCQRAGCWAKVIDGTNCILVQTQHKYFLPKDATGKISADGTFKSYVLTEEHAKEMLKESRNPKVKEEDIKGDQKMYVLVATGIKVYSK